MIIETIYTDVPYVNFYRYPPAIFPTQNKKKVINEILTSDYNDKSQVFTIYINIPFCRSRCNSCHYFSQILPKSNDECEILENYVTYLLIQISGINNYNIIQDKYCGAIFFGGGTASLLSPDQIGKILNALYAAFKMSDDVEITLEGNPMDFTESYMKSILNSGINRLSIGLQTFYHNLLVDILGSPHSSLESYNSIDNAMKTGFKTVNIDLLYAIPGQTVEDCKFDIETCLKYNPHSIKINWYVIHPRSKTEKLVYHNKLYSRHILSKERNELDVWINQKLRNAGYLEIRSGHYFMLGHEQMYGKLAYTRGSELIGFGAGAYSFLKGYLVESSKSIRAFTKDIDSELYLPIIKHSGKASLITLMKRFIIMNLMSYCIDRKLFKEKFDEDIMHYFGNEINILLSNSLIEIASGYISLTQLGKRWRRSIMYYFYSNQNI